MLGVIAENLDAASGQYNWQAGKYGNDQNAPSGDNYSYHVRVRSQNDAGIYDQSDQPFSIKRLMQQVPHEAIPLALKKPDLVVCTETAVYVPLKTLGWFHVRVRNVGQGTARAPFEIEIFVAGHEPYRRTVETDLGPGETRFVVNVADSKRTQTTIGFMVTADPGHVVAETNEDNNRASGVLYIEEGNPQSSSAITCGDGSTVQ
jgi:hypothetical protein